SSGESINVPTLFLGGTLSGSDTLTVSGLTTWDSGTMAQYGVTNANGGIDLRNVGSPPDKYLTGGRVLNTGGTTTWNGGQIYVSSGASIHNFGLWDVRIDSSVSNPS